MAEAKQLPTSSHEDVIEYLDYYLSPNRATDYAVMLDGPWGSGKTHFIKGYLQRRDEASNTADPLKPIGFLYASFYGVRTPSEITDQFYGQAHPILTSKAMRLIGSVASRALNGWVGTDVNSGQENVSWVREMVLKLDGRILVFDDLERSAMPLVEAMGFINTFVEHESLKVIVIANEADMPEDQKEDYANRKEKLVGKTLRVGSDAGEVLESFLSTLRNSAVVETVRRETSSVLQTFTASGKKNFRSMRSVLSDFERLVTAVDPRLRNSPAAMSRLLLFMIATGVEFRSGSLSATELAVIPETRRSRIISSVTKKPKTPEIDRLERLEAVYSQVDWSDSVVPPSSIAKLFETGVVDRHEIDLHLSRHPLVAGLAHTPAWRQLWAWSDLPRTQYLSASSEFVEDLAVRKFTHPGIILHAAGIVLTAKQFNSSMLGDQEDIVTYFDRYVEDLRSSKRLEPERQFFGPGNDSFEGLGYGSSDTPEFKAIYRKVREATMASFEDRMQKIAVGYVNRLANDADACSSLYETGVREGNYSDIPFLHYVDPGAFADQLFKDSMPNVSLFACLLKRYEWEKHNRLLTDEYAWIILLEKALTERVSHTLPPHKRLLEMRAGYYLGKIKEAIGDMDPKTWEAKSDIDDEMD